MVLSIHIPKTGGASFRRILADFFQEDFLLKYWQMTDAHGQAVAAVPSNIRCIHGHFVPDELLPQFPNAELITWVREPVERIISSYFHRRRDPDWQNPITREMHEKNLSLIEFASLDLMRNEMSRYLGTRRPSDFAFVGCSDQFETSISRFRTQFGLRDVSTPRENCNPDRHTDRYPIDSEIRRKIAALNERDVSLYQEVCASTLETASRAHEVAK
ncbi:MAG: hypothetical protein JWM32_1756 [Verrucomicrobia bacterium]|nr:hypothetical protein [Verrucomicrobiota bacterium]